MNRLLDHLPALYRDIKDFRELTKTASAEYDKFEAAFEQVDNDQFIITSSEAAIARRENDFGIVADRSTETLPFRKKRLLTRMQDKPPYTDEYLKELFGGLLGENMTLIQLDKLKLDMEVLVHVDSASFYEEVQRILERVVPLNVDITTALLLLKEYVQVKTKQYTFPVPYPVTGTFRTAPIKGIASKATAAAESKTYANPVYYPVTGTFVARDEPFVRLEGKGEDLRLERVDLWENRNLRLYKDIVTRNSAAADLSISNENIYFGDKSFKFGANSSELKYLRMIEGKRYEGGEIYTASLYIYGDVKKVSDFIFYDNNVGGEAPNISRKTEDVGKGYHRLSITFKVGRSGVPTHGVLLYNKLEVGKFLHVSGIKLEKGPVLTDWQPAPEDGVIWHHPETVKLIEIDLYKSGLYLNSKFTWTEETPPGTAAIVEYSFDKITWSKLTNGGSLPLKKYASLVGKQLYIRQVLTTTDQRITPVIRNFKYVINDKEAIM